MNSPLYQLEKTKAPAAEVPYGNYRQPVQLVWRMLTSGNRVALSSLLREASKLVVPPVDWMLAREESRCVQQDHHSTRPILLVVGAPRSGTTLINQTLARCTVVSYFSNLTDMFSRSPLTATRLFSSRFGAKPTNYQNYYGQTMGLSNPNDGFSIWNRWLGSDRYTTPSHFTEPVVHEMQNFFQAWTATFGLPLLNKNNRNTSCIALLAEAIPQAQFLVVRRDPLYVAQSLIHARENIQGDKRAVWGLESRSVHASSDPLGYVDDICDQLIDIENHLQAQINQVAASRIHLVQYENFCRDPAAFLISLQDKISEIKLRDSVMDQQLKPFEISKSKSATPDELTRIQKRF